MSARNLDRSAGHRRSSETLPQQRVQSALEAFGKKELLPNMWVRETKLACPQGQGDTDRQKPCMHRGRQKEWYKDFWLSRWQRSWRWLPFQAAKTALRSRSLLMWPHSSTSITTGSSNEHHYRGWAYGPIRTTSLKMGGAHG